MQLCSWHWPKEFFMKTSLIAVFILSLSLGAAAYKKKAAPAPVAPLRLSSSLLELQRVVSATDKDIANLGIDKPKSSWKTMWISSGSHKQQSEMAVSLQRNLETAVPELIREVQTSRGSVSSTFKLYNDLNAVHRTLGSLVESLNTHSRNTVPASLANDLSTMGRIRQQLSSYIQDASASLESGGKVSYTSSSTPAASSSQQLPKKIIVDDNEPDPKPVRKKTASLR